MVLAGGASRRMGTEKAMVRHAGGETFLERALRHLAEAGAEPIVVATGTAGRLGPLPVEEVDDGDAARGAGPLAGIAAALRRSAQPVVAVLAVDLTEASPALFRWLRAQWTAGDVALLPADATGRPQPLHGLVASALAEPIEASLAAGERRVLRVLEAAGARTIAPPAALGDGWARNRNTPE